MCVYIYICTYMYIHTYIYIYIHIHTYIYIYIYIYTYVFIYLLNNSLDTFSLSLSLCMHIYIYIYIYMCMCISLSIYIYIHSLGYARVSLRRSWRTACPSAASRRRRSLESYLQRRYHHSAAKRAIYDIGVITFYTIQPRELSTTSVSTTSVAQYRTRAPRPAWSFADWICRRALSYDSTQRVRARHRVSVRTYMLIKPLDARGNVMYTVT